MKTDAVLLEILNNRFSGIVAEMGYIIYRAGFSSYVKETWDFSPGLVTPGGEIFSFSKEIGTTVFIGTPMQGAIRAFSTYEPGDLIITNDPYTTEGMCTHLPDVHLLRPIFHEGELLCFAWSFVHCTDVSGIVPGNAPPSTFDVFQEGLRIPPTKLYEAGRLNEQVLKLILTNTRVPEQNWGDLKALIAAINSCEVRVAEVVKRYGVEAVRQGMVDLVEYGESRARQIFAALPDGRYEFSDYMEGLAEDALPSRIELALEKRGSDIVLDFEGTDLQTLASFNIPTYGNTHHFLCIGLVNYLLSKDPSCPLNSGLVRPITVRIPSGTILNPTPGASCSVRYVTAVRVMDCVYGALAQADPTNLVAAGGGMSAILLVSTVDPETGRHRMNVLQPMEGGMGGRASKDGVAAADFSVGYLRNVPSEAIEMELPIVVHRYELATDETGGAGEYRGGAGVHFEFENLAPECVLTARGMERQRFRPWGLRGGEAGNLTRYWVTTGGETREMRGKLDVLTLRPGDRVRIVTPSGGGFGPALARHPDRVLEDVRNDLITEAAARERYGVVVRDGVLDADATRRERAGRRPAGGETEVTWGLERDAFERVFAPPVQRQLVATLLGLPGSLRHYVRDQVRARLVNPRLGEGRAVSPEELDDFVKAVLRSVRTRGGAGVRAAADGH